MLATKKPSAWVAAMLAASLPRLDCKSNSPHLFVLARIGSARRTETEIDSTEPSLSPLRRFHARYEKAIRMGGSDVGSVVT